MLYINSGLTYRNHSLNWVECIEKKVSRATGNIIQQRFVHLTNMEISSELCAGISDTGRLRQKIENEGFNIQKNNGYALEHKYSRVSFQAMKNYYQCLQIAHILNQLIEKSQTIGTLLKSQAYKKHPFKVKTYTTSNMIISWLKGIMLDY